MKYLVVIAALLLGACSTVQPTDPFAELCRPESNRSCPGDTNTPFLLSETPDNSGFAAANAK